MKHRKLTLLFIVLILLCSVFFVISQKDIDIQLICKHFTSELYYNNLAKAVAYEIEESPIAGVFPHNEAIMDMSASVLKTASSYDYDTVILLAPNHKALIGKILISGGNWETPVGIVEGNEEIKDLICKNFGDGIIEETKVVQEDHSASIVLPYIKNYLQNAKVVTILLDKETTLNDIYKLASAIEKVSQNEKILLLGSIDFAHYQDYETTVMRDQYTLELIENGNIAQLKVLHGEHLDTSESLSVIMLYCEAKGAKLSLQEERVVSNLPYTNDYGSYMSMLSKF